jgi:hypothetical protein
MMGTPSEWVQVLVAGALWAVIFGFLLFGLHARNPRSDQVRLGPHVWFWLVGSLLFAGLSSGMTEVFRWRLLHGWLPLLFVVSLVAMGTSVGLYWRLVVSPESGADRDIDYDGVTSPAPTTPTTSGRAGMLRNEIQSAIEQAGYNKWRNQKKATYIKLATLVFSTVATILLGLKGFSAEDSFKNIAFALSASVTLLTALEPFFNFRSFWVEHEIAQGRFIGLRNDLDYYLAGPDAMPPDEVRLAAFHDSYNKIWADLNAVWAENRRREKN